MTFSPEGDKLLVVTMTGIVDVFDFDRCTGELSNWDTLGALAPYWPGDNTFYGCSFSPDGSKVYASEFYASPSNSRLWQWDLNSPDPYGSRTMIYASPDSVEMAQHQLGPDGKIYLSSLNEYDSLDASNFALSVINDPNQAGLACNFSYLGLPLKGLHTTYSLPNLPNYNLPPMVAQVAEAGPQPATACPGDSVRIGYPDSTNGAVTYRWWPTGGIADSTAAYTWASPDTTTMYYLTALDTAMGAPCGETVDSVLVSVVGRSDLPVASLGGDTTVCAGDSVRLSVTGETNWQYAWSTGDTTAQVTAPAGTWSVTVTNPAANLHCYTDSDTITIGVYPGPLPMFLPLAGADAVICMGDSVRLGNPQLAYWDYSWSPSGALDDPSANQPMAFPQATQMFTVLVTDSASGGACVQVLDTVRVTVEQPFAHDAPVGVTFCAGECFLLGVPPVAGLTYRWSPTTGLADPDSSMTRAQPAGTTQYSLTVTDPAAQSANCRTRAFHVAATMDACARQSVVAVNGDGVAELLDLGDHAGRVQLTVWDMAGRLVHLDLDYGNDWDAGTLAGGMYVYRAAVLGECPSFWTGKVMV